MDMLKPIDFRENERRIAAKRAIFEASENSEEFKNSGKDIESMAFPDVFDDLVAEDLLRAYAKIHTIVTENYLSVDTIGGKSIPHKDIVEALSSVNFEELLRRATKTRISALEREHKFKWTTETIEMTLEEAVKVVSKRFKIFDDELFFVEDTLFLRKLGSVSRLSVIALVICKYYSSEFFIDVSSRRCVVVEENLKKLSTADAGVESVIQFNDCMFTQNGEMRTLANGIYPRYTFNRYIADVLSAGKPSAVVPEVDDLILHLANGDEEVADHLVSRMAMSLIASQGLKNKLDAKCVFLYGPTAGNGKSTFADLLERAFHHENFKAFSIANFEGYYVAETAKALLMVDDDATEVYLSSDVAAKLKQVITADTISMRQIYKSPVSFRPYTQLLVCTNSIPKAEDKTMGWARRIEIFEVKERLVRDDAWFDRIRSDEAAEYMFEKLALRALEIAKLKGRIKVPQPIEKAAIEYRESNRNIPTWLERLDGGNDWLVGKPIGYTYEEYEKWCTVGNEAPLGKVKFTQLVAAETGLKRKNARITSKDGDVFVWLAEKQGKNPAEVANGGSLNAIVWSEK